jgi:hypothetical protein
MRPSTIASVSLLSITLLVASSAFAPAWAAGGEKHKAAAPTASSSTSPAAPVKPAGPIKRAACAVGNCLLKGLGYLHYVMPSTQLQLVAGKAFVNQRPRLARSLQVAGYTSLAAERFLLSSLAFGGPDGLLDAIATPGLDMESARVAGLMAINYATIPTTREAISTAHQSGKLKALAKHHSTPGHKVTPDDIATFLDVEPGIPGVKLRDIVKEARASNRNVGQVSWEKFIEKNGKISTEAPAAEQPK